MLLKTTTCLGPGRVAGAEGPHVKVVLPEGSVWARTAVAHFYQPAPGDEVLVLGGPDGYYVVGVLETAGPATIRVPADLEFQALNGSITFLSGREVKTRAPRISFQALDLRMTVRKVVQQLGTLHTRVRDAMQVRAGRVRTVADGQHETRAGRIVACAERDVRIDGTRINLG